MIKGSDVVIDFEKLISTQMEDVAVTITTVLQKSFRDATKILSLK